MTKCKKLRELIESKELSFIMEAHDGLSAKIVEESGFKAIWASGLSMSASLGVRDNNELSFKEVADHCYYMASRVDIPVLLDMDTGYGDFNVARTALRMIEKSGVAGVVVEDKVFPKKNSFLNNGSEALADPQEFALKLAALHEARQDNDFVIVARLESFLVGNTVEDAINRADIYCTIGKADALLVHSKKSDSEDIDKFMKEWNNRYDIPIIIVPTKYYSVPTKHFEDIGISTIIWANHNLRSVITAMKATCHSIYSTQSLIGVEDKIAPVSEVFRIQGNNELERDELKYLPKYEFDTAVILGASYMTDGTPKLLVKLRGQSVYNRQYNLCKSQGLTNIVASAPPEITSEENEDAFIICDDCRDYYELESLRKCLLSCSCDKMVVIYGDVLLHSGAMARLLNTASKSSADLDFLISDDSDLISYKEYLDEEHKHLITGVFTINNKDALKSILNHLNNRDLHKSRLIDLIHDLKKDMFVLEGVHIDNESWIDVNSYKNILGGVFND